MSYWQDRAIRNEAKAAKLAASYSARIKKLHSGTYNEIEKYIDSLLLDVQRGKIASRSELWRSKKYIDLRNAIREKMTGIAKAQIDITEMCLNNVFKSTIGANMRDFSSNWHFDTEQMLSQIINSEWSGKDFSSRIWTNTNALAARLEKDLSEMLLTGKDIHKQIMYDFNVSYNEAHRLITTESAHAYTEASKRAYEANDITEVEWIAEADCCEECAQYSGKVFQLNSAPMLPVHPNCRCCLAPVVNLKKNTD